MLECCYHGTVPLLCIERHVRNFEFWILIWRLLLFAPILCVRAARACAWSVCARAFVCLVFGWAERASVCSVVSLGI